MSNSVRRKLNFKNTRVNNMPTDQIYAQIKNEVSKAEKELQVGIGKSKKYKKKVSDAEKKIRIQKFIINDINKEIKNLEEYIKEGEQTLKNLKNVLNKQ
jgi:peptidoglycan hydrolase CwlO-like protein